MIKNIEKKPNNLYEIVKSINPTRVLEIGSFLGDSLWYWMQIAKPQSRFMVIDKLVDEDNSLFRKQIYYQNRIWYEWANEKDHDLQVMECYSQDPKAIYTAYQNINPVDFLFIKRDHTYNQIKCDFLAYFGLVRSGGIVSIHNILENEINKFWKEILDSKIFHTVEFIKDGIGVIYV